MFTVNDFAIAVMNTVCWQHYCWSTNACNSTAGLMLLVPKSLPIYHVQQAKLHQYCCYGMIDDQPLYQNTLLPLSHTPLNCCSQHSKHCHCQLVRPVVAEL